MKLGQEGQEITIQVKINQLTPAQIRLVKSLNTALYNVLTTSEEAGFFDNSAEFMRLCASIIQQSKFTTEIKANDKIPYADQALEYSMDILQEQIEQAKVVVYDN
jgi:hypothetical protein